jgi:hypothetical protein
MQIIAKYIFGLGAIIAFALLSLAILPAKAEYIDTTPDCDKYAVMYCGSFTKSEILKKYNNGDGKNSASNIKSVYDKFSISESKIKNANFKQGVVYKNGEVKIGSKVVATGAKTYIRTMGVVSTSKMGSAQAALVAVDSNGKFLFAIMTPCGNPISGKPVEPPKPKPQSLTCDNLTVTIVNKEKREVSAKVTGTPKNTTITGYKINFGDGTTVNQQSANHTYANYGKYTVTGYVTGKVDGSSKTVTSPACTKTVEFSKTPTPCPTNPELPADDPDCKPCPTNPELNYDDPKCEEPEEPEELPNTGAGSVIGLFTGVSLLGAIGHRMWISRRL